MLDHDCHHYRHLHYHGLQCHYLSLLSFASLSIIIIVIYHYHHYPSPSSLSIHHRRHCPSPSSLSITIVIVHHYRHCPLLSSLLSSSPSLSIIMAYYHYYHRHYYHSLWLWFVVVVHDTHNPSCIIGYPHSWSSSLLSSLLSL